MKYASPVGWLYLGRDQRVLARDFLSALRDDEETLDELGLSRMRAVLANRFFPGIVAGMTRARYLVFLPQLFDHLERQIRGGATFDPELERYRVQDRLRERLQKDRPNRGRGLGIIGSQSDDLQRYPSEIYWSALVSLGICRFQGARGTAASSSCCSRPAARALRD